MQMWFEVSTVQVGPKNPMYRCIGSTSKWTGHMHKDPHWQNVSLLVCSCETVYVDLVVSENRDPQ